MGHGIVADLSAQTCVFGKADELFVTKRQALGADPLREDADVDALWEKVSKSKKPIGLILMDQVSCTTVQCGAHFRVPTPGPTRPHPQSCFAGVGNIYRAEIL